MSDKQNITDNRLKWQNICTNPKVHNDSSYVYLVHAILCDPIARMIQNIDDNETTEKIDLVSNPQDISKKKIISCSLIGRGEKDGKRFEQLETWANIGLILKVPIENILRTGTEDLGADYSNPDEEIRLHKNDVINLPDDLLFAQQQDYNEVVVLGETEHGKAEIIGIFASKYSSQLLEEEKESLEKLKNNLPLLPQVDIPPKDKLHATQDNPINANNKEMWNIPENLRRLLNPVEVVRNALRQTSTLKTNEADSIEQSELKPENIKEGETKDD